MRGLGGCRGRWVHGSKQELAVDNSPPADVARYLPSVWPGRGIVVHYTKVRANQGTCPHGVQRVSKRQTVTDHKRLK